MFNGKIAGVFFFLVTFLAVTHLQRLNKLEMSIYMYTTVATLSTFNDTHF